MNYQEEIQRFLDNDELEFEEWIADCPITEAPALILEYKSYMQKLAIENDDFEAVQDLQELDDLVERIENFTIDTLAARQEKFNQMEKLLKKLKEVQEIISHNELKEIPVSIELISDLREIADYLKSQGLYDSETWKKLQHLL